MGKPFGPGISLNGFAAMPSTAWVWAERNLKYLLAFRLGLFLQKFWSDKGGRVANLKAIT